MSGTDTREAPEASPGGRRARREAERRTRARGGRLAAVLVFLLPAAAAAAMTLRGIGERPLRADEHATWWAATLSFHDLSLLIRTDDVVRTPYYVLMHAWVAVAGDSPGALRVPGALAVACAAGLLALLGRRLFTPRTGLLAGFAFALVPAATRSAQEIRPYAFAVAAVLLSTLLLARALDRPAFKAWVAYTLSVPLIGWSDLAALTVLGAHLAMVLAARRAGDRIAGWAFTAAGALGLCFVVPMAVQGAEQTAWSAVPGPGVRDLADFPQTLFGSWTVAVPVTVLGLAGLCFAGRRALPAALWIGLPPLVACVTVSRLFLLPPGRLLFTVPAWLLLAAVAVARPAGPVAGPRAGTGAAVRRGLGWVLAAAAVAGLAWQALPGLREVRENPPGTPDYRGAARIVEAGQRTGDGIAFGGGPEVRRALAYELRDDTGRPRDVLMYRTPRQRGSYAALECPRPAECLATAHRLWLVSAGSGGRPLSGLPRATARAVESGFRVVRTRRLTGLRLVLLERTRDPAGVSSGQEDPARRKVHV